MASIQFACRNCGSATDTAQARDGACLACVIRKAVEPELTEYRRLWAKRRRYARANARHNDRQLQRLEQKIAKRISMYQSGEAGEQFFGQLIHEARSFAENVGGRIAIAQPGDTLPKRWPDGVRTMR